MMAKKTVNINGLRIKIFPRNQDGVDGKSVKSVAEWKGGIILQKQESICRLNFKRQLKNSTNDLDASGRGSDGPSLAPASHSMDMDFRAFWRGQVQIVRVVVVEED